MLSYVVVLRLGLKPEIPLRVLDPILAFQAQLRKISGFASSCVTSLILNLRDLYSEICASVKLSQSKPLAFEEGGIGGLMMVH